MNRLRAKLPSVMVGVLLFIVFGGTLCGAVLNQINEPSNIRPADEEGYFAWQQSWITDFDFDCTDELAILNSIYYTNQLNVHGKNITINKYSTGMSQLMLPFTAPAQAVVLVGNRLLGWDMREDGMAGPVVRAAWVGLTLWSVLGLLAIYFTITHWYGHLTAALALCAVWAGTSVFAYTWKIPLGSHGATMSMLACAVWLVVVRATPEAILRRNVLVAMGIGFCAAMAVVVRPTQALLLIPVGLLCLSRIYYAWRMSLTVSLTETLTESSTKAPTKASTNVLQFAGLVILGMTLPLGVEMAARYFTSGSIFFNGYARTGETFDWAAPHVWDVMFWTSIGPMHFGRGVFTAHPLTVLCVIGLLWIAWKQHGEQRLLAGGWLIAVVATIYMYGCWWFWNLGWSYGARWAADFGIVWTLGLAWFIHKWHTRPIASAIYLIPLAVWSIVTCV